MARIEQRHTALHKPYNKSKKIEIKQTEIRVEIEKDIKQKRGKDEKDRD